MDSDLFKNRDNTPLWMKPEPYPDNSSKYRSTYLKSPTSPRKLPPNDEFCLSCSSHLNFSSAMRRKLSSKRKSVSWINFIWCRRFCTFFYPQYPYDSSDRLFWYIVYIFLIASFISCERLLLSFAITRFSIE